MRNTKLKFSFTVLLSLQSLALAGNYMKCSENYCQNDGNCLVMSGSLQNLPNENALNPDSSFFVANGNQQNWFKANASCSEHGGKLYFYEESGESALDINIGAQIFIQNYVSDDKVSGFWTGFTPDIENQCYLLDQFGSSLKNSCSDTYDIETGGLYLGLCQRNHLEFSQFTPHDSLPSHPYYYSCQCKEGYGFENCTETSDSGGGINFGYTYCQKDEETITINSLSDTQPLIFIDHVAYGSPLEPQKPDSYCEGHYAPSIDKYCVSGNSLAAVTYWCQGKRNCSFSPKWLLNQNDVTDENVEPEMTSLFYVHNQGSPVKDFSAAVQSCGKFGGTLAKLKSEKSASTALKIIAAASNSSYQSDVEGFWIDARSLNSFKNLTADGAITHEKSCIVLLKDSNLKIKWESCFGKETYGALCEAHFGQSLHKGIEDNTCFNELTHPILEYRLHLGPPLSRRTVDCPMDVNYQRANTCYKQTEEATDWLSARAQCWSYGGDLAFPLPKDDEECRARIWSKGEETWLAGPNDCGGARCPIPFNSELFVEGTYSGGGSDLCFMLPHNNKTLKLHGLCAIPVAMVPRTPLPPVDSCPKLQPGDDDWPFPNYSWNVEGQSGQILKQPCPDGQIGSAVWECGYDGNWIGFPDLTNCSKIDTTKSMQDLNDTNSVPSDVIASLYQNVSRESELGAGDIHNIIDVLNVALDVQYDRLESAEDPTDYADKYTTESVTMMSDILDRPDSWFGIPSSLKNVELSKLQINLDDVAKSLIRYSASEQHKYQSSSLTVQIRRNLEIPTVDFQTESGDEISLTSPDIDHIASSVSFVSFSNFGCIVDGRFNCSETVLEGEDVLNTKVIGASLYNAQNNTLISPKSVLLKFRTENSRVNVTDRRCVYWDVKTNAWSSDKCTVVSENADEVICQCDHLTNFGVIMDVNGNLDNDVVNALLTWITIFGCSLSIVSLIICVYVFTAIRGLRTDRTTIHRNLCLNLLLAELLLVIGLDQTQNPALCGVIAGFLHYLFLTTFAWMLVEGIDVYLMLVKVFDTGRSMVTYFYVIGYGGPAVIVVLSVIIVEASGTHGYGTPDHCWLDFSNGFIWAFGAPVACVLVVNSVMFMIAIRIARKSIQKRGQSSERTLALIKGSASLMCILGMTWILGFTYFANGSEWMAILFTLLNSLQGVFILLFHVVLNDKAKQELLRHLKSTKSEVKTYFSKDYSTPPNAARDTITDLSSKAFESTDKGNRKISSNMTYSTDMTGNGTSAGVEGSGGVEEGVKYYRGQITMTVTSSALTTAAPQDTEQPTTTKKTSTAPALTTSGNSALENREKVLNHLENKSK